MKMFFLKPISFIKFSHCSEKRNDALMHREGSTLKALNYFSITYVDQKVFQFKIIKNILVSSFRISFEYICYGSTDNINIFTLTVRGSTLDVRF